MDCSSLGWPSRHHPYVARCESDTILVAIRHAGHVNKRDADGGTFGQLTELSWREQDRLPREYGLPASSMPKYLSDALPKAVAKEIAVWSYAIPLAGGSLYQHLASTASKYILTGAINDAVALVLHVDRLDGRSAAHAARALFEHLVNFYDVLDGIEEASDRYLDHRHITADRVAHHRWYLAELDKKSAKREQNRLDGLANRTRKPLAEAVAKYGKAFQRSWAAGTLRDRADAHGLSEGYEGYRILSSVIHGSSGAMAGIVKSIDGQPVHRIGPDIDLAATAFAEGLVSFYRIADRLRVVAPVTEAEEVLGRTGNLINNLQQIRETLRRLDKQTWPRHASPATVTVAGIWPNGKVRWYLHDLREESMVLADLLDPEPDLTELIKKAAAYDADAFGGRPMSVACSAVRATARQDAPWVPAASILIPPGHPATRHYGRGE